MNYYNENSPKAAAWLRELITLKLIPNGTVDDRSITDVTPSDLRGFTQCHFFAGILGWPLALGIAGFPADRPIFTASCPCQPFSVAGQGKGNDDERHLWPVFFDLVRQCRPERIIGEQVASKAALSWFDGVSSDLEGAGYACGAVDICAAGVGETQHPITQESAAILRAIAERTDISDSLREQLLASAECVAELLVGGPHIRSRLYWLADANGGRLQQRDAGQRAISESDTNSDLGPVADSSSTGTGRNSRAALATEAERCGKWSSDGVRCSDKPVSGRSTCGKDYATECCSVGVALGDTNSSGLIQQCGTVTVPAEQPPSELRGDTSWSDFTILPCLDNKARRVESGTFPLVDGIPGGVGHSGYPGLPISAAEANATAEGRVMRLHGYGNAICIPVAVEFIKAVMEITPSHSEEDSK